MVSGNILPVLIQLSKNATFASTDSSALIEYFENNQEYIFSYYEVLAPELQKTFMSNLNLILSDKNPSRDIFYDSILKHLPNLVVEILQDSSKNKNAIKYISDGRVSSVVEQLSAAVGIFKLEEIVQQMLETDSGFELFSSYLTRAVDPKKIRNSQVAARKIFLTQMLASEELMGKLIANAKGRKIFIYSDIVHEKISANRVVAFIKKYRSQFIMPETNEEIPLNLNPVMLAFKFKHYELLMYAFENASEPPWNLFWKQIDDKDKDIATNLSEIIAKMVDERKNEAAFNQLLTSSLEFSAKSKVSKLLVDCISGGSENINVVFAKCLKIYPALLASCIKDLIAADKSDKIPVLGVVLGLKDVENALQAILDGSDEQLKSNIFDIILESGQEQLLYEILNSSKISPLVELAYNYFSENSGKALIKFKANNFSIDKLVSTFKSVQKFRKFKFSTLLPQVLDIELINKMLPYIDVARVTDDEFDPLENPLIIASKTEAGKKFIQYAFENRSNDPWKAYWLNCGESSNYLMLHCFKYQKAEMLKFLLNNESIISNLNMDFFNKTSRLSKENYGYDHKLSIINMKLLPGLSINNIQQLFSMRNSADVSKFSDLHYWFVRRLLYLRGSVNQHIFLGEESATDGKFADQVKLIINYELLNNRLDQRYPGLDKDAKKAAAQEDYKLFMLLQFLKNVPSTENERAYKDWQALSSLICESLNLNIAHVQELTFLNFKQVVKNSTTKHILYAVINGTSLKNQNEADVVEKINSLLRFGTPAKSGWLKEIRYAWRTVQDNTSIGNFRRAEIIDFTLTCMLLVTDNIDTDMSKVSNMQELLKLVEKQPLVWRANIENAVSLEAAKKLVRNYLLETQKTMEQSLLLQAIDCCLANGESGSCITGIYTRFGRNVINLHNKYSLVQAGGREGLIQETIHAVFKNFVHDKILKMWQANIKNLKINLATKSSLLNANSISELRTIISTLMGDDKSIVVNSIPEMTDQEPRNFIDALFSLSADEWCNIYKQWRNKNLYKLVIRR